MLLFTKLNKEANAEKRSSSQKLENRELPGGARQSEADRELTLEQPAEDPQGCVGSDGIPAVERGKAC